MTTKLIDINNTLDLVKLKFYNEWLYSAHLYDEGESPYHKQVTEKVVDDYIVPMNLPKDASILDCGCGPGYFLDKMKDIGYTNVTGITLSQKDFANNTARGHKVKQFDFTWLPQSDGFWDETVDLVFLRHVLEHSPYPIFTLMEYNRILKLKGKIYIEVPAPDCERKHEWNPNHYSIMGHEQLIALLVRTGFTVQKFDTFTFNLEIPQDDGNKLQVEEKYYILVCEKTKALDIK